MYCEHVYKDMNANPCPKCGKDTHETDWNLQNKLQKEWKDANPDRKFEWMSI